MRSLWQTELELGRKLLADRHLLDTVKHLLGRITNDDPPVCHLLRRIQWSIGQVVVGTILIDLTVQREVDSDRRAGVEAVLVFDLVLYLNVGVRVDKLSDAGPDKSAQVIKEKADSQLPLVHPEQVISLIILALHNVVHRVLASLLEALQNVFVEVGHLLEVRIVVPDSLDAHLRKVHSTCAVEERLGRHDIDASGKKTDDLAKDQRLVDLEVFAEVESGKVGLKEKEGLEVRRSVVRGVDLDAAAVVQPAKRSLFVVANWEVLELLCGGNNLKQTLELGSRLQRSTESLDSYV